jgi:two-component system, NarL family, sensor histidine kinase UhpB
VLFVVKLPRHRGPNRLSDESDTKVLPDPNVPELEMANRSRRRNAKLRDVERHFRLLLENSYDGIVLMGADTAWHYISSGASALLGYMPEQVLGRCGAELVHPDDLPSFDKCIRKVTRQPKHEGDLSFRMRYRDGTWRSVEARFANYLSDPCVLAIICNFRVISDLGAGDSRAAAIHQPQNLSSLVEAARADERKRIAQEIHDELGSCLTVIKLYLGSINENSWSGRPGFGVTLNELIELVTSALKTVNDISTRLRPCVMEYHTLWPAIEWLSGEVQRAAGIRCELEFNPSAVSRAISSDRSTMLFRVVQEGLTNVMKHARATRVKIRATVVGNDILVSIRDDGKGVAASASNKSGVWGIIGMQERVNVLGGTLKIGSHKAGGTTLNVRLPLD